MKLEESEKHPWQWFAPTGCKVLVIGTFPTANKNRAFDFFYPNPRNLFWSVMGHLVNKKIIHFSGTDAVEERKKVLTTLQIAITDMGNEVIRTGTSSLDADLTPVSYMDIKRILDENKSIRTIILTSSSGKHSAYAWFINYARLQNLNLEIIKTNFPFYGQLLYNHREIKIAVLPSTSPAAAQSMDNLVSLYLREIG